ncbi:MAG TPA: HEAT repeat domain-containing protein [Gemmataceae bacterium]
MFRYRCPRCSVVLQALEIRAGKNTVCSKCSRPIIIPADKAQWVNEKGDPLLTSPTIVLPTGLTPPPLLRPMAIDAASESSADADNDVLGAISHGDIDLPSEAEPTAAPELAAAFELPQASPAPAFSRSLPKPDDDDGRVELYPAAPAVPAPVAETPRPPRTPQPVTPPPRREPEPAWSGPSSRSPSRGQRVVNSVPADTSAVALPEPLRLRTGMDIAVDLTSALAMRMKPPPRPPRDLKPSTALWVLATGIGVALFAASLATSRNFAEVVRAIGLAELLGGYAWITYLAYRRDPQRGIACAIPPLTFIYLRDRRYAKYRPLRFVVGGAALIGLAFLVPLVQPHTRQWAGVGDSQPTITAQPDIATQSKLEQLRHYRDQRQYDALIGLLRTLARTDSVYSDEAKNRIDLAAELRALSKHMDSGVKIEALAAYATWGGTDARELCLEASRSQNREERMMALRLLPRWQDEDVARRIGEMIGRAGTETSAAQDALITLGGPIAERAVIPLLRKEDQGIRLTAIEILGNEKVGGADALAALKEVARLSPDPGTRQPAEIKAQQILERLKK